MKIIDNHYNGSPTYIVGKWIKNGCTYAPITEVSKLKKQHQIDQSVIDVLMSEYKKNKKVKEDYKALLKLNNPILNNLIAYNGRCLDVLHNTIPFTVRHYLIDENIGLEYFINSTSPYIRRLANKRMNNGIDSISDTIITFTKLYEYN